MTKHKKLNAIDCECGEKISIRALARHLRAKRFNHSDNYVNYCINLINFNKKNRGAWKKSEGVNALLDEYWCHKVLNKEISMEELVFESPREPGTGRPVTLKRISEERKGKGNPSLINKPTYDVLKIKEAATKYFFELGENPSKFKLLDSFLDEKFLNYRYSFVGIFPAHGSKRGHNRRNTILSFLIDKPIEWIVRQKALDRGKFIKEGQRKSQKFDKIISAGRQKLKSFVSIPHRVLYNMILSVDPNAVMEKQLDYGKTWKSYDIFSPKINALIEMHGACWHDWYKCKPSILSLVVSNVKNDVKKKILACNNGYDLVVFWDDQTNKWEEQVHNLYGEKSKEYGQALCEEIDKKRDAGSL